IVRPTIVDCDVVAVDIAGLPQAAVECSELLAPRSGRTAIEEADHRPARRLRARGQRPCDHPPDQKGDEGQELAPHDMLPRLTAGVRPYPSDRYIISGYRELCDLIHNSAA